MSNNTQEVPLFSKLKLNDKYLTDLQPIIETNHSTYRLYVDVPSTHKGFYAIAVSFSSCSGTGNVWEDPTLEVDVLFEVTALFDGIRHLEFNRGHEKNFDGYIYYPDIKYLNKLLQKIEELEETYCDAYI